MNEKKFKYHQKVYIAQSDGGAEFHLEAGVISAIYTAFSGKIRYQVATAFNIVNADPSQIYESVEDFISQVKDHVIDEI